MAGQYYPSWYYPAPAYPAQYSIWQTPHVQEPQMQPAPLPPPSSTVPPATDFQAKLLQQVESLDFFIWTLSNDVAALKEKHAQMEAPPRESYPPPALAIDRAVNHHHTPPTRNPVRFWCETCEAPHSASTCMIHRHYLQTVTSTTPHQDDQVNRTQEEDHNLVMVEEEEEEEHDLVAEPESEEGTLLHPFCVPGHNMQALCQSPVSMPQEEVDPEEIPEEETDLEEIPEQGPTSTPHQEVALEEIPQEEVDLEEIWVEDLMPEKCCYYITKELEDRVLRSPQSVDSLEWWDPHHPSLQLVPEVPEEVPHVANLLAALFVNCMGTSIKDNPPCCTLLATRQALRGRPDFEEQLKYNQIWSGHCRFTG